MSKLSFRARALDPTKPMPIYLAEELPDLPEYSAINRAVPQMPSGMEKEEESEHHLQRAICTGLIIPTPEVLDTDHNFYDRNYPADYKMTRQMIHMQPLGMEQDIPDYDMDTADEAWVTSQNRRLDLNPLKFEQMMDRLEKSSGQTVVTLNEAKALLKQDDEVSIAVYDYWLNKRLKTQHPLILSVRTENRAGAAANNPYLAFRRRTEKMQTRKNRKNDETSYEKMLKLRRDLSRAVTLLELIKRREKTKREHLHLSIEVFEKRYQAKDFSGHLLSEYTSNAVKTARPAFAPIYANQYSHTSLSSATQPPTPQWSGNHHQFSATQYHSVTTGTTIKREVDVVSSSSSRKEKRQYKKRKHKAQRDKPYPSPGPATIESMVSSDEEEPASTNHLGHETVDDEGLYQFRRNKTCQYHRPLINEVGNWPWTSKEENGLADPKYRFTLTSLRQHRPRCIGFARRRVGRGGRVILDRISTNLDDVWSNMDFTIYDNDTSKQNQPNIINIKDETDSSVVVDLVTNRKNSIDSVGRTKTPSWSDNNVIKSEQKTVLIKQESLDDFDNCLRLSNHSSSFSSGTTSSGIVSMGSEYSDIVSPVMPSGNQNITFRQCEANRSESLTRSLSSSNVLIKTEPMKTCVQNEIPDDTKSIPSVPTKSDEEVYSEFLNEIRRDWLHFRPKTPPDDDSDNKCDFDEEPIQFTETTPLTIEIQRLGEQPPSSILMDTQDNVFLTNSFSLDDIMDDPIVGNHDSSSSGIDINISGDSLPELSLSLGENEDNEKMLDHILQECQFDDLKSFNANTNFWNGILEDTPGLIDIDDNKKNIFGKIGITSDLILSGDERLKKGKRKLSQKNLDIGCSTFTILNIPKDDFFKKEDPPPQPSTPTEVDAINNTSSDALIPPSQIKIEPANEILESPPIIKTQNIAVIKTEVVHSSPLSSGGMQKTNLIQQTMPALAENTLILSPATNTPLRRHTNGPTDKNAIQNLLKQASLMNRKFQIQPRPEAIEGEIKPKPIDGTTYIKMASFPSDFNVVTANNVALNASAVAANHNYSLAPQTIHHQPITLIGQSSQSHNKFIINAAPTHSDSNIAYATPIQDMQNKITIPSSNIKVNLVPSSLSVQPGLSSCTSGVDNNKTTILTTAHPQHLQAQQQQQNRKTVNMLFDSDKNRILYTTNIKNNRGQQIFAQLNSSKVLNILPIQHKNNATGTVQGIVTPTGIINKAHTVQRLGNVSNTQTISSIRQQTNSVGVGSVGNVGGITTVGSSESVTKIVQNSDGSTVSGGTMNTSNR